MDKAPGQSNSLSENLWLVANASLFNKKATRIILNFYGRATLYMQKEPYRRVYTQAIISSFELLFITSSYFLFLWVIAPNLAIKGLVPFANILLFSFIIYFIYISPALIHGDSLAARGLGQWQTLFVRIDNLSNAAKYYFGLAAIGGGIIFVVALIFKPKVFSDFSWYALRIKLGVYFLHALGQDLLFLSFFLPRLRNICAFAAACGPLRHQFLKNNSLTVSFGCATLFAIYHIPNLPLILLVFLFGFALAYIYCHVPNLILATITHTILGTMLHRLLEMNLYVGPFYWHTDKSVYRTLFPALREIIGNTF